MGRTGDVMLSRRQFLALPLAVLFLPRLGRAGQLVRSGAYHADIRILFGFLTFTLDGSVHEEVDRSAGRYQILVAGEGPGIANRIESEGLIQQQRLVPTATLLRFNGNGRESQTRITYDYDSGLVHYRHASRTFLLGRRRVAEDVIEIPAGQPLDDAVTMFRNYAEGLLEHDGQGAYRTFVVHRARPEQEGLDDVQAGGYRADMVPIRFTVTESPDSGRGVSLLDLTRFSSWARASHPARITFGPNRGLEAIDASLRLGTRIQITFQSTSGVASQEQRTRLQRETGPTGGGAANSASQFHGAP